VTWKLGPARSQGVRNNSSLAAKRENRARAEAEGFALIERETKLRREKTEKLRKLREARDAEEANEAEAK
jgi:hypothetical protein